MAWKPYHKNTINECPFRNPALRCLLEKLGVVPPKKPDEDELECAFYYTAEGPQMGIR